jgi:hypothetical protein
MLAAYYFGYLVGALVVVGIVFLVEKLQDKSSNYETGTGSNYKFKTFYLERTKDVSGVSGTGPIAHGTLLRGGWVMLEWITPDHRSIGIYPSIEELMSIHGHEGSTLLKWVSDNES